MSSDGPSSEGSVDTDLWASCLLLVAAYDDVCPAVMRAVAQARWTILQSPVLTDFVTLRLVPLGARGGDVVDIGETLLAELTAPRADAAPINYSALAVIDDDAIDAAALLAAFGTACADADLDAFRIGLVTRDERASEDDGPVTVLPAGASLSDALADALRGVCEDIMSRAAADKLRGLSPAMLVERPAEEEATSSLAELSASAPAAVEPSPAKSDADALAPSTGSRRAPDARRPAPGGAQRRQRKRAETSPAEPGATPGLVLVSLVGGTESASREAVRRAREVALELDAAFAELAPVVEGIGHTVLLLDGDGEVVTVPHRKRGRRRVVPKPARFADFPRQLRVIDGALTRETSLAVHRAGHAARPTLVLVVVEAPMADPVSARLLAELTTRARVVCVLVGDAAALMSERLREHAIVVTDHAAIAADVRARIAEAEAPTAAQETAG